MSVFNQSNKIYKEIVFLKEVVILFIKPSRKHKVQLEISILVAKIKAAIQGW